MSDTRTFELKVGVFILIGIAILFLIVFSVGDINLSKTGYKIKVLFGFAAGIGPSAPVRLAGVGVGQIQGIRIIRDEEAKSTRAEITAWINDGAKIEKDAVVTINTLGLLGEKYLEIFPGTSGAPLLKSGETIEGKDPVPMEKITEDLAKLSGSVNAIVERLKKGEGTIGKLLTDDSIYENLEEFTADIKRHPWKLLNKPRGED
ncbi:MAG: MlaD family protein [Candidatus Omnitrophota bacterium]